MQGFVLQGRAYEGLACNGIEWVASFGGGTIIDPEGKITINNPQAAAALNMARGWIGTISPEGVLNYAEEDVARRVPVRQCGVHAQLALCLGACQCGGQPDQGQGRHRGSCPRATARKRKHTAALGGQQLAVSKYSAHPKEAADLVRYLTSAAEQKRRAIKGSFNPTRKSLYGDEELLAANPFFKDFEAVIASAVARPSTVTGAKYNQVSSEFVRAVHNTLSGQRIGRGQSCAARKDARPAEPRRPMVDPAMAEAAAAGQIVARHSADEPDARLPNSARGRLGCSSRR